MASLQRKKPDLMRSIVYADREHCANLRYLTGLNPRLEEALQVLVDGRVPTTIAGLENQNSAAASMEVAAPYFACAAEWCETIGIGVTGGALDALVRTAPATRSPI